MKFSILVPAYKPQFLAECIESILAQTYPDWELIIVNDASPYDIDSIVGKYSDSRIRYFKNAIGYGAEHVVGNWNKCLSYAKGEYVICMGDDDVLSTNCLEYYNNMILSHPDIDIFHMRTKIIDEVGRLIKIQEARPEYESVYSMIWHRICKGRLQYIGDFLFRTSQIKMEGGFYSLPFACFSDDISTYRTAIRHGICNCNEFGFLYRENRHTITKTQNLRGAAEAAFGALNWIESFLSPEIDNEYDSYYRSFTLQELPKYKLRYFINIYVKDMMQGKFFESLNFWFKKREQYGIPKVFFWRLAFGVFRRKLFRLEL